MGGLEIIIIDGSKTAHGRRGRPNGTDVALATDRKIHPGALVVLSAREMVDCVLARAGRREIHRLIIWGHGCPGVQGIGAGDNFLHLDRIAPRILRVNDARSANAVPAGRRYTTPFRRSAAICSSL